MDRIDTLLAAEQDRWVAVDPALGPPFEALRKIIRGGKRLRPTFCRWGFIGAGGDPADARIEDAGAAVELLHMMALIHDDIIDNSTRRHGTTCLHVDFAHRFETAGWRGEARRFGDGVAILIGDLAFVYADKLLRGAPSDALDVWDEMRLEVNAGQYLDVLASATRAASIEQAHTICVYKAGKYTIERPLHLGAALAGGLPDLAPLYTAYGLPLGEAFQLVDDLLGAFGDDRVLGKGVGEDIRDGKPTALFAIARSRAGGAALDLLDHRYGEPDLTDEEVGAIAAVFEDTGARSDISERAAALSLQAVAALDGVALAGGAADGLRELAAFVVSRDR